MKKFVLVGLLITASAALAVQQLDTNISRFLTALRTGILVGPASIFTTDAKINASRVTRSLGASATIDFTSAYAGSALSSSITVTGARAGDPCTVGVPTAAAALLADFTCFVDATNSVKVQFAPTSTQIGQATLVSASPSQVVVAGITASSLCTATPVGLTAAIAAGGLATSLTTTNLTITGPNTVTTVVNYVCAAPVDPASGTFYVRVVSSQ